ncbi:RagB/SusD family nutrient uptake outer membrane protein [Pedobacter sp. MR2016-19]|uniref:RagB/SusD family nutrient uptake outer membrane protein n=1 Tax=Pedobacter sp. MR2016-19 TaxID=2780089 RepID=UPI001875259C|nr:RagB/SusD family nutrient uptake outer membrane protein [Pedobacter sp. MR2016-19]MBE5321182.1 RagB/SusD family nutrient uptake outer membrane protein [Pedobacter sp. MR2016-19]
MKTIKITNTIIISQLVMMLVCIFTSGCKKFVDVDAPSNQLVTGTVFTNDNTVNSALAGMYNNFAISRSPDLQFSMSFLNGCAADEAQYSTSGSEFDAFTLNGLQADNVYLSSMWTSCYSVVYQANAVIEGVNSSSGGISDAMKVEALGEAKFIRALCYFYLVNLWGDVPMPLSTDRSVNNSLSHSAKAIVYQQIIKDLNEAKGSLSANYSYSSGQRTRPNKYAAAALLARAYLYIGDWANAEANATLVINAGSFSLLSTANLNGIFVKNNAEAILQFDASPSGTAGQGFTNEGESFALDITTIPDFQLSSGLLKAFESGDRRYTNWVGTTTYQGTAYYYFSKYKQRVANTTAAGEYVTCLRLAEQYLIRAEARAKQANLTGAVADINVIRNRAGLLNTTATLQSDILLAIEQERRIELFGEYGHRWNDLRRTGRANTVLGALKSTWSANDALYPIPKIEIQNNSNLSQNPGY